MTQRKPKIALARVYDAPAPNGSYRILVDRLWPRGMKKEGLALDAWMKELAPSTALRRWFNHDPDRWLEFRTRYFKELATRQAEIAKLCEIARKQPLLLLYAAHDEKHNNAVALKDYLERHPHVHKV